MSTDREEDMLRQDVAGSDVFDLKWPEYEPDVLREQPAAPCERDEPTPPIILWTRPVLRLVNTVREVRGLAPLARLDVSDAVVGDPARCILALALRCRVDAEQMYFESSRAARAVGAAVGEAVVDEVAVELPQPLAELVYAFDTGSLVLLEEEPDEHGVDGCNTTGCWRDAAAETMAVSS